MPRRLLLAAERIAKGASFVEIAKELGKNEKDIDLGTVTKAGVIDRAVADAAFALKEGEVSAPVRAGSAPVLVQVLKIEPEQVRPFDQVAGELKQELATARAKTEILTSTTRSRMRAPKASRWPRLPPTLKLEARTLEGRSLGARSHRPPGRIFPMRNGAGRGF